MEVPRPTMSHGARSGVSNRVFFHAWGSRVLIQFVAWAVHSHAASASGRRELLLLDMSFGRRLGRSSLREREEKAKSATSRRRRGAGCNGQVRRSGFIRTAA